jgi:ZIP family zinc transporter
MIPTGIGLHNFPEGLPSAAGPRAGSGRWPCCSRWVLLHTATEGFGIGAPVAGDGERPPWGCLALLGLIGGGPTFVGIRVGRSVVNETLVWPPSLSRQAPCSTW